MFTIFSLPSVSLFNFILAVPICTQAFETTLMHVFNILYTMLNEFDFFRFVKRVKILKTLLFVKTVKISLI